MNRLIDPLLERYRNDALFHTIVDGSVAMYRNTGSYPRRMIKGDEYNDAFSAQDFADAVRLARHITKDDEDATNPH